MALAVSTVPTSNGIPSNFFIRSVATTNGGLVTIRYDGCDGTNEIACTQTVDWDGDSILNTAKWSGGIDDVTRVASELEYRAIIEAFIWLEMRNIFATEFEVSASTDIHGNVSVLLCVPLEIDSDYFFKRGVNGLCIGP
jgi:hypothetical protein